MSRGRAMRPIDFEQFQTTVNLWFGLRIATVQDVAARVGCVDDTLHKVRSGRGRTTYKTAGEIMQAIGQIEQRYIKQWRDRRACYESH